MAGTVEHIRHGGGFPAGINCFVFRHFDVGDRSGQTSVRIPAAKGIPASDRDLIQVYDCAGGIALIPVRSSAIALIVRVSFVDILPPEV